MKKGDELLAMKYIVKNVAHRNGKTATFMPKPIHDNGSGMKRASTAKGGTNLFAGDLYGGLSQTALYYIGGIFKHARAINAFTNSTTNSYKRLVPGFEAPVMLAYSARNRSASCRIPFVHSPKARRIEVRFPDPMNSGYLAFTALMMAGLDGILNKIDPGAPMDKDLYDLPPEEEKHIPTVCSSLDQALDALNKDRAFLKAGGVLSRRFHRRLYRNQVGGSHPFRAATHPIEYQMYYSIRKQVQWQRYQNLCAQTPAVSRSRMIASAANSRCATVYPAAAVLPEPDGESGFQKSRTTMACSAAVKRFASA